MTDEGSEGGITLLETTVLLGTVFVFASLAIPETVAIRESARRQQCAAKLKAIGDAIAEYDQVMGHLPRAGHYDPIYGGWAATLLPYLGEHEVAAQYDHTHNWFDQVNSDVVKTQLSRLICPASPDTKPIRPLKILGEVHEDREAAASDYMAPRGFIDKRHSADGRPALGALGWFNQTPRRSDIVDGLSMTLMISEQSARWGYWIERELQTTQDDQTYANWVGPWASYNAIWIRTRTGDGDVQRTSCGVNCNNSDGLYSFHEEGVNALMADGSVRLIATGVNDTILFALISRDGGEVIGSGDF